MTHHMSSARAVCCTVNSRACVIQITLVVIQLCYLCKRPKLLKALTGAWTVGETDL
jgi:hypothetical protein